MIKFFNKTIELFLSVRTAIWLFNLILAMFLAGALIMPGRKEFQSIHATTMFEWLKEQPFGITWWLWGLIVIFSVLAINTVFCSIDSLIKKQKVTRWLILLAPQIIHTGFLFILLAHLLSALGSFQEYAVVRQGSILKIKNTGKTLRVQDIHILSDHSGHITDWSVNIEYLLNGEIFHKDTIKPNKPSIEMGFNVNVKDIRMAPHKTALLQISKDPGAVWALFGSLLFIAGIVTLIALKIKLER